MGRALYLPPAPLVPVSQIPRAQIRSLAHTYGHHRRQASNRFCFLLPIVARDEIFLDDGCLDVYEWAQKFASMSCQEVDRILNLFGKIGKYDCLWTLVGEGVGISKLERLAPHATAANAAWLAERAGQLTKPEIEELVRQIKKPAASEAAPVPSRPSQQALSLDPQAASGPATLPGPCPGGSGVGPGAAAPSCPGDAPAPAPSADGSIAVGVRSISGLMPALPAGESAVPGEPGTGALPGELGATASQLEPGKAATQAQEDLSVPSVPDYDDAPSSELDSEIPEVVAMKTSVRCSLELDAVGEKRIRELQALYQRLHGRPIGTGQLFSLLARVAIASGELPSVEEVDSGLLPDRRLCRQCLATVAPALDNPETEPAAEGDSAPSRRAPGQRQDGKHFRPKLLEVVISVAETGWQFVRTALGWTPVPAGALAGFLSPAQAIPLDNLRIAAIAAAQKPTGSRYRPVAVERYLLARSGGYCEVAGCNRRAVATHHTNRFAFDPSHHPDHLACVCKMHHGGAHAGLFRNESTDTGAWELIEEGDEPQLSDADRKFLSQRGT